MNIVITATWARTKSLSSDSRYQGMSHDDIIDHEIHMIGTCINAAATQGLRRIWYEFEEKVTSAVVADVEFILISKGFIIELDAYDFSMDKTIDMCIKW